MGTPLPEGIVAVVKADCPTCRLVTPVLAELREAGVGLTVYTQDDPAFPPGLDAVDDTELDVSVALDLDTVPTLIRVLTDLPRTPTEKVQKAELRKDGRKDCVQVG